MAARFDGDWRWEDRPPSGESEITPSALQMHLRDMIGIRLTAPGHIALSGELDIATAPYALAALDWASTRSTDLVVDLHDLTFMDATGVRMFLDLRRRMDDRGDLTLAAPCAAVAKVLDIVGIDGLPNVHVAAQNRDRR
ncbi:MAG: STAS domain-containing protein [Actinomycetota bacterium]